MQALKKFIFKELIFTGSVGIIALILFQTVFQNYHLPVFWVLLAVIALLTGVMHYSILQVAEKDVVKFSSRFMMVSGIKMMIYLVIITSYVFSNPTNAKSFLIFFFILYAIYTAFEVILIVKYFKNKK